jgi:CheY-like chemotaxis protein
MKINNYTLLGKRILFVNDNPLKLFSLQRKLHQSGMKILQASSSKEAIAMFRKNIDVVVLNMDVRSMNAYELCYNMKAIMPGVPVIAYIAECEYHQFLNSVCDSFFEEHYSGFSMLQIISGVMHIKPEFIHLN